jgi:hypothetical protein
VDNPQFQLCRQSLCLVEPAPQAFQRMQRNRDNEIGAAQNLAPGTRRELGKRFRQTSPSVVLERMNDVAQSLIVTTGRRAASHE